MLSSFVHEATLKALPSAVVDRTLLQILDCVGCCAVGSKLPWVEQIRGYALETGQRARATVFDGPGLVAEWAALVNATSAHSFELDDYHTGALSHPGCVVVPVVLAVGQELGSSGQDIILACALGLETIVRLGLATVPSLVVDRGFHETCIQGVFGAAVAAGKLMGLGVADLISALGIAGSHASGTREYSHSGGEAKRLHAGLGAAGGIRGAKLAARGFRGPARILEGSRGVLQAFTDKFSLDVICDGLGVDWHFMDCGFKPYASCGLIHAPTDALMDLMRRYSLTVENVEEIVVGIDRLTMEHCGSLPIQPTDMTGAQFNLPFSLGMTLVMGGNGFREYWQLQQRAFIEPRVVAAARKIRLEIDPEANAAFPKDLIATVRVRKSDGTFVTQTSRARGSKDNPLTPENMRDKFRSLMRETPWERDTEAVMTAVANLPTGGTASGVMSAFESPRTETA
jgi:2-methylcitrate dehydratase PrpD